MAMIYDNNIVMAMNYGFNGGFYGHDLGIMIFNGRGCSQMLYGQVLVCALPLYPPWPIDLIAVFLCAPKTLKDSLVSLAGGLKRFELFEK